MRFLSQKYLKKFKQLAEDQMKKTIIMIKQSLKNIRSLAELN